MWFSVYHQCALSAAVVVVLAYNIMITECSVLQGAVTTILQCKIHLPQTPLYAVYPILQMHFESVVAQMALASAHSSVTMHVASSATSAALAAHRIE